MSQRTGQRRYIAHIGSDTLQSTVRQLQTVVERIVFRHLRQVLGIGLQDPFLVVGDGLRHRQENLVTLLVGQQGEAFARLFYLFECFL